MYTILNTRVDQDGAGSSNSSTLAENSDKAPDWNVPGSDTYWTRLILSFVDSHNPTDMADFVFNTVFDSTAVDTKSVTVNLTAKSRRKLSATTPEHDSLKYPSKLNTDEPRLYKADSSRYPSSHLSTPPKSK